MLVSWAHLSCLFPRKGADSGYQQFVTTHTETELEEEGLSLLAITSFPVVCLYFLYTSASEVTAGKITQGLYRRAFSEVDLIECQRRMWWEPQHKPWPVTFGPKALQFTYEV